MTSSEEKTAPQPPLSQQGLFAIDGARIKAIREGQKLTQLYIATSLGVTVDTVSRWENGRTTNIKEENAERLAEILAISLADIAPAVSGDQQKATPLPPAEDDGDKGADGAGSTPGPEQGSAPRLPWRLFLALAAVALSALLAFIIFLPPGADQIQLEVSRLLPRHAAPKQPFPVVIKVRVSGAASSGPVSFIIKEKVADNCQVIEGEPPFMVVNQAGRFIKWLSQGGAGEIHYFAYLAIAGSQAGYGERLVFSGEALVQGRRAMNQGLAGDTSLAITNYHWADSDRDQVISDEEILTIYNSFAVLQKLGVDLDEIRRIWAGPGYRWDPEEEGFVALTNP
ncbi:MAG: helix-turn-helix transcriptional regulator [Thermodesulfobacteriota bacterium]